jgi:hypothetical protein
MGGYDTLCVDQLNLTSSLSNFNLAYTLVVPGLEMLPTLGDHGYAFNGRP